MTNSKTTAMQAGPDEAAVVENRDLPDMDSPLIPGTMDDAPEVSTFGDGMQRAAMSTPPPSEHLAGEDEPPAEEYPDMEPRTEDTTPMTNAESFAAADQGEAYLRLVVEVDEGIMTVMDASVVDSPLVVQSDLTGEMAYQASIDGRRVGSEAFADLSHSHGLPDPDRPELGHHIAELPSYDFVVRIPRGDVSVDELDRLRIELFRTENTVTIPRDLNPLPGMTFETAADMRGVELPGSIASLDGVNLDRLPSDAANAIRSKLR